MSWFHLYKILRLRKFTHIKVDQQLPRARENRQIINGYEFVWELIKCSKVSCGDCCITTYHEHLRFWRDDPSTSTCYSSIKLEFSSDHPHWQIQGSLYPLLASVCSAHKCHAHTYRQIKINLNKSSFCTSERVRN